MDSCAQQTKKQQGSSGRAPGWRTKKSVCCVPCQRIEGKPCILQISYSCTNYGFKVDPFRGKKENSENDIKTAIREAKEESAQLLRFKEEDLSSVFQSGDDFTFIRSLLVAH